MVLVASVAMAPWDGADLSLNDGPLLRCCLPLFGWFFSPTLSLVSTTVSELVFFLGCFVGSNEKGSVLLYNYGSLQIFYGYERERVPLRMARIVASLLGLKISLVQYSCYGLSSQRWPLASCTTLWDWTPRPHERLGSSPLLTTIGLKLCMEVGWSSTRWTIWAWVHLAICASFDGGEYNSALLYLYLIIEQLLNVYPVL